MKNKNTKQKRKNQSKKTGNKPSELGQVMRGIGQLLGAGAGGMLGGANGATLGRSLGHRAGAQLSYWTGQGDYKVSKNSLVQSPSSAVPMMHKNDQTVTVRHREFLGTINGSTSFKIQKEIVINPGLEETFPWLSAIAARFEQYTMKGLIFHYIPTSGTFSGTSAALGSVMFQTTYRSGESAPVSKAEMMNEYWATETVASTPTVHPLECDPKENPFSIHYVRSIGMTSGEALMYDLGKTFVATSGMDTTGVVGDLWITYEVELKKPIVTSSVQVNDNVFIGRLPIVDHTNIFGSGVFTSTYGDNDFKYNGRTITFPSGYSGDFRIQFRLLGTYSTTGSSISWNQLGVVTNCSFISILGAEQEGLSYTATSVTQMVYLVNLRLHGNGEATYTVPPASISPTATISNGVCEVMVTHLA